MDGPTYKGREVKKGEGKGTGRVPPVITVPPGSSGARIVTGHGYPPIYVFRGPAMLSSQSIALPIFWTVTMIISSDLDRPNVA